MSVEDPWKILPSVFSIPSQFASELVHEYYIFSIEYSAGINRDWAGVPRKMFKPGKKDPTCVCVKTTGPSSDTGEGNEGDLRNRNLQEYPGCDKYDASCKL